MSSMFAVGGRTGSLHCNPEGSATAQRATRALARDALLRSTVQHRGNSKQRRASSEAAVCSQQIFRARDQRGRGGTKGAARIPQRPHADAGGVGILEE